MLGAITDYGTGNPYHSMTPLVTGEIAGEDLAYYLTESQQTPSCSWDLGPSFSMKKTRSRLPGFLLGTGLAKCDEEEIIRFEKRIQEMPAISAFFTSV
ncbi:MAG: Hsp33 family molecular chaperone HslO [Streptococcus sp.]